MASLGMQINSPLITEPDQIDQLQLFAKRERRNNQPICTAESKSEYPLSGT